MRRGSVLIVVAGLCALLASLTVAFLLRMRGDVEETAAVERQMQSRIMLLAGCDYVLEAGRLGYDVDPHRNATREHTEAFGWIDIRDATVGPRDQHRAALFSTALVEDGDGDGAPDRPAWPAIGSVARCPMYAMERPPYAIREAVSYNPIDTDPASATYGVPLLLHPDPQPVVDNGWDPSAPAAVNDARFAEFARGDTAPRAESVGIAWFRCYRESASVFVITTGAGGSLGFRDWDEVRGAGAQDAFGDDPAAFALCVATEQRLQHRVEWTPEMVEQSETGYQYHLQWDTSPAHQRNPWVDSPVHELTNMSLESPGGSTMNVAVKRAPNCLGSIRWVQRLETPPARW